MGNARDDESIRQTINVEQRPIQMIWARPFHIAELLGRHAFKQCEVDERKQQFFVAEEQPEAMLRHADDPGRIIL